MKTKHLHKWNNLTYAGAAALQLRLAGMVEHTPLTKSPRTVAGLDCAFSKDKKRICAVCAVLKFESLEIIETACAIMEVTFPYIPGLLSFREAPVCIAAAGKLKTRPDLFIIDGQGIAHPRRMGLASHLGLFFDTPTIGCAKSRLLGSFKTPAEEKGSSSELYAQNEIIGAVLRTRTNVKPLFVSVGHKCTLENAIELTLACTTKYRLPEPTRLAHIAVSKLKNTL